MKTLKKLVEQIDGARKIVLTNNDEVLTVSKWAASEDGYSKKPIMLELPTKIVEAANSIIETFQSETTYTDGWEATLIVNGGKAELVVSDDCYVISCGSWTLDELNEI